MYQLHVLGICVRCMRFVRLYSWTMDEVVCDCQSTCHRSGRAASRRDFNSSNAHPSRQPIATQVSPSSTTTPAKESHPLTSISARNLKLTTKPTHTHPKCPKHSPSSRRYVPSHPSIHPTLKPRNTNHALQNSTSTSASKCNSTARAKSWARCAATTSSSTSSSTKPPRASPTTRKSAWECA